MVRLDYKERDQYGLYKDLCHVYYEEYGVTIWYRQYAGSPQVKKMGGSYVLWCEELNEYVFARNDYMAMHRLDAFINKCSSKLKLRGGEEGV